MNKIITSDETDIELDADSLTEGESINLSEQEKKNKRLEAIRDIESLLDNTENLYKENLTKKQSKKDIDCIIQLKSKQCKNHYTINAQLVSLNQTLLERNITEIELTGQEQKLIGLFLFYNSNIYRQKRMRKLNSKVIIQKNRSLKKRKRKLISKNDVLLTKFDMKLNDKKLNMIDFEQYIWKVNEVRYSFENNKSTLKILLVKGK